MNTHTLILAAVLIAVPVVVLAACALVVLVWS